MTIQEVVEKWNEELRGSTHHYLGDVDGLIKSLEEFVEKEHSGSTCKFTEVYKKRLIGTNPVKRDGTKEGEKEETIEEIDLVYLKNGIANLFDANDDIVPIINDEIDEWFRLIIKMGNKNKRQNLSEKIGKIVDTWNEDLIDIGHRVDKEYIEELKQQLKKAVEK
jgi:hypothetical protein